MRAVHLVAAGLLALASVPAHADDPPRKVRDHLSDLDRMLPPDEERPPATFEEGNIFTRLFPPGINRQEPVLCANKRVLRQIVDRFAWAENRTWHRGFVIARLENPQLRYDVPAEEVGMVPRRYCEARAVMTNGETYTVYYTTEEELGFASIGDYVDFCVLGLDPWRVHDGFCRTVR
jgi:hypothetical protein